MVELAFLQDESKLSNKRDSPPVYPPLKLTASLPLKMDVGWKTIRLPGFGVSPIFRCYAAILVLLGWFAGAVHWVASPYEILWRSRLRLMRLEAIGSEVTPRQHGGCKGDHPAGKHGVSLLETSSKHLGHWPSIQIRLCQSSKVREARHDSWRFEDLRKKNSRHLFESCSKWAQREAFENS